ncbi:XrtA-associated ATPase [Vibrio hannami]|uniref:XrtA/PEP-CTERM system-associated ATPase n=1 Tax=Vibrio hannami TaxID=2717094 RepID=UPI00241012F9|nr:XrtA/PEP-CTERM system-associated ATPase [Vibrio hannami]MDG3088264.1 XrtA-associated ATPase [Vibrio hannami]
MYESYFGLSGKPFRLSPDPRFFFESPHHGKAISYLRYGLELGEGFIVITGPVGTGKTTIARSLLSTLSNSIVAAQIATTCLSPEELVNLVAAEFGLQVEGLTKADILKRFETFLRNLSAQGKRALLIIDEAQNLPSETIEELRMLSNFQIDDKPLIQSFLLGQEELKPIIELPEMEQFRQRIIASCHLRPLNKDETREYILHRLKQVGWTDNPRFESKAFKTIANYTGGVPRKINIFMDRLFLFAFMEEHNHISTDEVEQVIQELGNELSGGMQPAKPVSGEQAMPLYKKKQIAAEKAAAGMNGNSVDLETMQKVLSDVSFILEDVVQKKTLTIKHLDRLIREKRKELSNPDEPSVSTSKSENHINRLAKKVWMRQLIKEQEGEV